jgi:pyridoxine 5-phosphate synthase
VATAIGAHGIELHTGGWAETWQGAHVPDREAAANALHVLRRAAAHGRAAGLAVHAGHGLTYENVARVAAIDEIEELNIGHSVIGRAVLVGMERAVADMKAIILRWRSSGT